MIKKPIRSQTFVIDFFQYNNQTNETKVIIKTT